MTFRDSPPPSAASHSAAPHLPSNSCAGHAGGALCECKPSSRESEGAALGSLEKILTLASEGSNQTAQNTMLTALRSCSVTLCKACDSCRTRICLCSAQITTGSAHLKKLPSLTDVAVHMGNGSTVRSDLVLVSRGVPALTSLTLIPGPQLPNLQKCHVWNINLSLKPFRDRLQHLCVQDCSLMYDICINPSNGPSSQNSSSNYVQAQAEKPVIQEGWCLDLPALKSLILHRCQLKCLILDSCQGLEVLELFGNRSLSSLVILDTKVMHRVVCVQNPRLAVLDLSSCPALNSLECHHNDRLIDLTLPSKQGIKFEF